MLSTLRGRLVDRFTSRVNAFKLSRRHHTTDPEALRKLLLALPKMTCRDFALVPSELLPRGMEKSLRNAAVEVLDIRPRESHTLIAFRFPSPIRCDFPENNVVSGEFYIVGRDYPTAVILHGWLSPNLMYYRYMVVRALLEAEINSLIFELPYHMSRTPEGYLSGELYLSGDLCRSVSAVGQSLMEVRTVLDWLRNEGYSNIGLYGISLGGLLAALMTVLDESLAFSVLLVPAAEPEATILHSVLCRPIKRDLTRSGVSEETLRKIYRPIAPGNCQPAVTKDRIMIVEGLADQIVFPASVERLHKAWGKPLIRRYPDGHMTVLTRWDMLKDTARFITNIADNH